MQTLFALQAVEDSPRRLQIDSIDLYQAHRPDVDTPLEETLRAMDDLVRQGRVRDIGCSDYNDWQVAQTRGISERLGLSPWISAPNRWNRLEDLDIHCCRMPAARWGLASSRSLRWRPAS